MMYGKTVSEMPADFKQVVDSIAGEKVVKLVDAHEEQIAQHIHIVAKTKSGRRLTFCVLCFEAQDFSLACDRLVSGRAETFWKAFLSTVRADYIVGMDVSGVFPTDNIFVAPRWTLLEMVDHDGPVALTKEMAGTFFHFFVLGHFGKETVFVLGHKELLN